jgi:hypothetical protein
MEDEKLAGVEARFASSSRAPDCRGSLNRWIGLRARNVRSPHRSSMVQRDPELGNMERRPPLLLLLARPTPLDRPPYVNASLPVDAVRRVIVNAVQLDPAKRQLPGVRPGGAEVQRLTLDGTPCTGYALPLRSCGPH